MRWDDPEYLKTQKNKQQKELHKSYLRSAASYNSRFIKMQQYYS